MCTAATYHTKDHYFGRSLDYEHSFGETVTICPREYRLIFRRLAPMETHYAMIGMAVVVEGYPLYFDATNELGLSMAALNFPYSAKYMPDDGTKNNLAPYELIPWILASCKCVKDAVDKLRNTNIANIAFSNAYPITPLHWIVADAEQSITVEQTSEGIAIYDNPVGILTNEPPFPYQMTHLQNYMNVTADEPSNRFSSALNLQPFSRGMGGIGLPGDYSSSSRFIKAVFNKWNSVSKDSESASVSQFFHILESVAQPQGCVKVGTGYEKTIYTSCCNTTKGIYYYTSYENHQITGIRLHGINLDSGSLVTYPLRKGQVFHIEN